MNHLNHIIDAKGAYSFNNIPILYEQGYSNKKTLHVLGKQTNYHSKTGVLYFSGCKVTDTNYTMPLQSKDFPDFYIHSKIFTCPYVIDNMVNLVDPSNKSDIVFSFAALELLTNKLDIMIDDGMAEVNSYTLSRCDNIQRAKKSGMTMRGYNRNLFISQYLHFNEGKNTVGYYTPYKEQSFVIPLKGVSDIVEWATSSNTTDEIICISTKSLHDITSSLYKASLTSTEYTYNFITVTGEPEFYKLINMPDTFHTKQWIGEKISTGEIVINDSVIRSLFKEWLLTYTHAHRISENLYSDMISINTRKQALKANQERCRRKIKEKGIKKSTIEKREIFINPEKLHTLLEQKDIEKNIYKNAENIMLSIDDGKMPIMFYKHDFGGRRYEISPMLQNLPSEIRDMLLLDTDAYSIDIEASAATLLRQIAIRCTNGQNEFPYLTEFVNNKKDLREKIASECNCTLATAKKALTSVIFGGLRFSTGFIYLKESKQVMKEFNCSVDSMYNIKTHPFMEGLIEELDHLRKAILSKYFDPDTRILKIPHLFDDDSNNFFEYSFANERMNSGKIIAFTYMSLETMLMELTNSFLEEHDYYINLYMHDGVYIKDLKNNRSLNTLIDIVKECEEYIHNKTGFKIKFDVKGI